MSVKLEELLKSHNVNSVDFNNMVNEITLPNLKSAGISDDTIYMMRVNYCLRLLMYRHNIYDTDIFLMLSDDVTIDIWESRLPKIVSFFVEQQLI